MRPGSPAGGRRSRGRALFAVAAALCITTTFAGFSAAPRAAAAPANPSSLRFGGSGAALPGLDRLLIAVDPPTPADVGAADFTIEWWMAATAADNFGSLVTCDSAGYTWIFGRTLLDRDRLPDRNGTDGRDFGASITSDGRVAFGDQNSAGQSWTACSAGANVLDGAWHHVAVQRSISGLIEIWIDGVLRTSAAGPAGDLSYPDGAPASLAADPYLVVGAAKRDTGGPQLSYRGLFDELRLSTGRRYGANFLRPTGPFTPDATTAALYHFDGAAGACPAAFADATGRVDAACRSNGATPTLSSLVPSWRVDRVPPAPPGPPPGTVSFHPIPPQRLADTRPGLLAAGGVLQVQVTGVATIPAGATAASLNLTVVEPAGPGYLTAWPCGQPRPLASNLNHRAGQTVANLATVGLGAGGRVCIFTLAPAALLVDVGGWWGPGGGVGFGPVSPVRLTDTRPQRLAAGAVLEVPVAGRGGVPVDAQAAALNITSLSSTVNGFVTAWPCGQPRPATSTLNHAAGQTVANLAAVALGIGGKVCLSSSATAALLVDLNGWWGPSGIAYALPPTAPTRLLDTRPGLVPAGGIVRVPVPPGSAVAALNLTMTGPQGQGYLAAFPCGQAVPTTSNLNYAFGQTVAAAALVPPGPDGAVCVFTSAPGFVVVDLFGGMAVSDVATQALGGRLYALQWGYTQLGAPYAAVNPYRFGDSTWGRRWPCPSGWTSCAAVDIHGSARTADTGDWVYDCSGFVVAAFQRAGVDLVRLNAGWSDAMYRSLPRVPLEQRQPGDLLLFGLGEKTPSDPTTHVGIYLTGDRMLNSTTGCGGWQGVCTSTIDWTRVVAVARAPLAGTPGITITQGGPTGPAPAQVLDPYSGAE